MVLVAALRALSGALPEGLRGSVLLRGVDGYLRELARLERRPGPALLPEWATEEAAPETPAVAAEEKR